MAILTKGMTLGYRTSGSGSYTTLTDLLEVPALGGSVDKVDVTTLADDSKKYIKGLIDYGDLQFKFNYAKDQFKALDALTGSVSFQVTLPDETTATFSGEPTVSLESASVGAPLTYTMSIALDSEIVFA